MNRFCGICKEYNCIAHARPSSLTQRLTNLLEYFEEPEEDMRTYIEPEKTKTGTNGTSLPIKTDNFDRHDSRISREAAGAFNETSLTDMSLVNDVKMMPRSSSPAVTTSSIVHVGHTGSANKEFLTDQSGPPKLPQLTGGRYRAHERHHFVKIHASSFVSCSSPTGSYSEVAIILWVDNKGFSKSSSDRYRVVLSMMYDVEEDLWSISSKLLKRTTYYSKDEEEGQISNRLCLTSELRSEIKKMLLYLGISPREAYRMFRRNMNEQFIVSASEFGFKTVESASHAALLKDLDKTTPTSATGWDSHRRHYSPHGQQFSQNHHTTRPDPDSMYKAAILGYSEECWGGSSE